MTEFWAALAGAIVGGVLALLANLLAARWSAKNAISQWQRDKSAQVLERFISNYSRIHKFALSGDQAEKSRQEFYDSVIQVKIWAIDFFPAASRIYTLTSDLSNQMLENPEALSTSHKSFELRVREHFGARP